MLIKELHIQNFRRFEDLRVSFEEDLTVLVARNGQGKSSILEAVTILLGTFAGAFDLEHSLGRRRQRWRSRPGVEQLEPTQPVGPQ